MMNKDLFDISLSRPVCVANLSEDDLREIVNALEVTVQDDNFSGFVLSSGNSQVEFRFGADGNFLGVYAKVGGKNVVLVQGAGGTSLGIFKGAPSATNPGAGWAIETELTRSILGQPVDENQWEIFYASRVSVINNI